MPADEGHTAIRVHGGGLEIRPATQNGGFNLEASAIQPLRSEPRYSLNLLTLGRIERLAKARFILSEKAPEFDPSKLDKDDADTSRSIALSVFASSEIEGEGISADYVEAFVAAHTEMGEKVDGELQQRLHAHRDIIDTYFWALNLQPDTILTYDFVLEAHRRMFHSTKEAIAGQIKNREVRIRWCRSDGVLVDLPTISANRAEEFLRALCERTSNMFRVAQEAAEAPMLLAAAEFACDFLAIHPFLDGNGRTARLLSTYLLKRGGYNFSRIYPLDQIVLDSRADYYDALNTSQRYWHTSQEDLTAWINYFIGAVFEQWERAYRRICNHATRNK
ncbi:MAG: Fic family protein [Deltaproteobacteria bacterium]|nr:Fic family protein [Deltaproteobacteria bacterium]